MPLASLSSWSFEASPQAQRVDWVALFVLAICTILAAGVCLTLVGFCLRYRQGTSANRATLPRPISLSRLSGF